MGQRHNRRRTRPRSRNSNQLPHDKDTATATPVFPGPGAPLAVPASSIWSPQLTYAEPIPVSAAYPCPSRGPPGLGTPAPLWHYGYSTWRTREGVPDTSSTVETAQCRVFGGEPGDDVALCERMLEYFGGLDYIDS
ncbi:hypothetical protein N7474_004854 [Penicillium riverlandense]|uniref:uncharacterized protein n=1 Tax=Penicillium riverlandense TaxID=1903569 RepID=UPI002547E4F0|nr:uncharacterized protein N7474_004854 [Penicillium riverlandense]KAJ5819263.1 hypothetical protein N7474_004854 [Penicillium riverlandense]